MRIKMSRDHDHTFPSGAMLALKDGWEGTVKREVGEAAIKAGAAKEARTPRTASSAADTPAKRSPGRLRKATTPAAAPAAPDPVPVPPPPPPEPAADETRAPGAGDAPAPLPAGDNS